MASRMRRSPHRRPSIALGIPVTVLALLAPMLLGSSQQASAAPTREEQLEQELAELNEKANRLVEDYLEQELKLKHTRKTLGSLQSQAEQAKQEMEQLRERVAARATAAYVYGPGTDLAALLSSSDPTQAVERMETLEVLAGRDASLLEAMGFARRNYQERKKALAAVEKEQAAAVGKLADKKEEIQAAVRRTEVLLRQARAAGLAPAAPQPGEISPGAASGAAAIAVKFALAQVGKPYAWGADGPGSYDCSGLTMTAWGRAGVALPHSSRAQYSVGRHVTRAELRPGDLIFRYSPISHVSIYIGNGNQVSATNSGDYVRVQPAFTSSVVGYSRPTG